VLNEVKNRGVKDILIISVDELKGFSNAITSAFPETEVQKHTSPDKVIYQVYLLQICKSFYL